MKWLKKLFFGSPSQATNLEENLKKYSSRVSLSEDRKSFLKNRIMRHIKATPIEAENFGYDNLIHRIKEIAYGLTPQAHFTFLLREKLLTLVDFERTRLTNPFSAKMARRLMGALVGLIFVVTVLFNFTFTIPRLEASYTTVIEEITGEVTIVRDGAEIIASKGFLLKGDDVIRTGEGSKAVIRFLDQSITRLDQATEVKISRLFINPQNRNETVVELVLHKGRVWNRVISLIDNLSHFQVKAHNTTAVAKKKAAFDVALSSKNQAKVSAVANRVDLLVSTEQRVVETTLVKGFTAEVKSDVTPVIHKEDGKKEGTWIADNLAEDKAYIEGVKQAVQQQNRDQVAVLPGNPFYVVKELSQSTQIALASDEVDRNEKILRAAEGKFAEAQLLLQQGHADKAQGLIEEFTKHTTTVIEWIKQRQEKDSAGALKLKAQLNEMIGIYEKKLAVILPTDPSYTLKEIITQIKILQTDDPIEKTEAKLSQAGDKLLEAHDLAEQGNTEKAQEQVKAYTEVINSVVSDVKQLSSDTQEKAVNIILDNKLEDLKVLESIVPADSGVKPEPPTPPALIPAPDDETSTKPEIDAPTTPELTPPLGTQDTIPSSEPNQKTLIEGGTSLSIEAAATNAAIASGEADLKQSVADAKTEALTKLGQVVLEAQKNQTRFEILQKLRDLKKIEVNGKPFLRLDLSRDRIMIKTDEGTISVTDTPPLKPSAPETPAPAPTPVTLPLPTPTPTLTPVAPLKPISPPSIN